MISRLIWLTGCFFLIFPGEFFAFSLSTANAAMTLESFENRPKLILVLVIDQFRADYLTRFSSRFLNSRQPQGKVGGYRYLMSSGAYFPFAQFDVLQNMTGPGHSMILSGAYPYRTGIPSNNWVDEKSGKETYCVADPDAEIVGANIPEKGMSPRNFIGTTIGDELKNAGFDSKVVAISLKDRAAILLGGHRADLSLWFNPASFRWVSSRFYLPDGKLPNWLSSMNSNLEAQKGNPYEWKSSGKPSGLTLGTEGFSHTTTIGNKETLSMPYGIDLTTQTALKALDTYQLGKHQSPDLLAISYSSHDYLSHQFGPNTLELEEMTLAEDRSLSLLLNAVNSQVPGGLKNVVVVLTADHGIPPSPSWLSTVRIDAGKLDQELITSRLEKRLVEKFGKTKKGTWIISITELSVFLNHAEISARGLSIEPFISEVKAELSGISGISTMVTATDWASRRLPPGVIERQALKTYFSGRSGDVIIVPKPFYMHDGDPITHVTGYNYDSTVPLIFSGAKFTPGVYSAPVDIIDIAPTLSFLLGTIRPALAEGRVLTEALESKSISKSK